MGIREELHHIADAGKAQPVSVHAHSPYHQKAAPLFRSFFVGAGVLELALGGAEVFRPLLFHMDESPLSAAKAKVLDPGHREILIRICHGQSISVQVIPWGSASREMVSW